MLNLERRRLEREKEAQAAKAIAALEVSENKGVKSEDVDLIVS